MSQQQQQQQQPKPSISTRELEADKRLNQHLFRIGAYTAVGFGAGLLTSLLFKRKAGITLLGAGAGAGYGASGLINDWQNTF